MASVARSLRRCSRILARSGPIAPAYRSFSVTAPTLMPEDPPIPAAPRDPRPENLPPAPEYSPDLLTEEERTMYDMMSPEERAAFDEDNRQMVAQFNDIGARKRMFEELDKYVTQIERETPMTFDEGRLKRNQIGFWADTEVDEFALVQDQDEVEDDEITSMAHAEVELHREIREYARIAAWDMPFLSKLAQPFQLPPETHILRFRYTTYMGESHPAENKVVVELSSRDLVPKYLTEAQRQTFLKLVGPRYNPDKDLVRMSSEKFSTRAQNKRYLGDLIGSLLKEAKEGDPFTDIPLDLRHHKPKTKLRFPESWIMTPERKKQLEANRAERARRLQEREGIVDGNAILAQAVKSLPAFNPELRAQATKEREKVAMKVGAKSQKQKLR
ncbi:mitochondrial ribosomal subunit protein-domain-containing protein [Aspergillus egyptiacus]|nr:mitochondrial ribosomal subunit protein-domain-containing protein [Aspergillus egyptiacus]